jgi:hypothetical protein
VNLNLASGKKFLLGANTAGNINIASPLLKGTNLCNVELAISGDWRIKKLCHRMKNVAARARGNLWHSFFST